MNTIEARLWHDDRRHGVAHAVAGVTIGWGIGALGGTRLLPTAVASYLAIAGRGLGDAARTVGDALARDDLAGARAALPALVGRDPSELGPGEIARAVVESVAENTVDAIVAPALWGVAAGASGALAYRAVNTMDAMVGHHNDRYERYGWASARLDDLANFLPARVTALLVIACRPRRARAVARAVRHDAPAHPSPNAGVAEAAFAAALGVQLGGTNHYGTRTESRAALGDGEPPGPPDIRRAVALSRDVSLTLAGLLLVGAAGTVTRRHR